MVVASTETLSTLMHNNNENNNKIAMMNSHLDVEMSPTVNIDDLINSSDMLPLDLSTIQQFYSGCNIFITGGTGFLGKTMLQKILSTCPNIECIYLLVRNKKGKDVHSRVEEIFDDQMFDHMKEVCPKFRYLVQAVAGDCSSPQLGISEMDQDMLIKKVNIVFHMAATVRFDEKLKIATQINVQATKDMLALCSKMECLKSLIHVSTAYTHCPRKQVDEKFYTPPIDSNNMLVLTKYTSDELLETITPLLLNEWPNTYTFTKAIAEDVLKKNCHNIPVGMVRPGIVISTYQEPVSGWIDNFYGPTGVIAGAGTGVLRSLRCNPKMNANMVPVDLCVNSILTAAWDVARQYNTKISVEPEIPVYNFCTPVDNELTWGDFTEKTIKYGVMYPTSKAIWYLCYSNNPNRFMHWLAILFLHYLPAIIVDALTLMIGRKPRLLNTYKKIHRFMNVIEYFSMRQWEFQTDNVNALWHRLDDRDKKLFFFDMRQLNWDYFLEHYFRGVRKYLLNDPIETVPEALIKWNRLFWLHTFVKVVTSVLLVRVLWSVVCFFS